MQRYSINYKAGLRLLNWRILRAMWKFTFSCLKQHLIEVSSLYSSAWGKRFECKADQKFLFYRIHEKRPFCGGPWRVTKREEHFSHCATNTLEMVKDDSINHHPPLDTRKVLQENAVLLHWFESSVFKPTHILITTRGFIKPVTDQITAAYICKKKVA